MKQSSSPTLDSSQTSTALTFVKNVSKPASNGRAPTVEQKQRSTKESTNSLVQKDIPKADKKSRNSPRTSNQNEQLIYEPFSTRIRQDIKRRLKKLSHQREEHGHQTFTTQALIEEALLAWLAKNSK